MKDIKVKYVNLKQISDDKAIIYRLSILFNNGETASMWIDKCETTFMLSNELSEFAKQISSMEVKK